MLTSLLPSLFASSLPARHSELYFQPGEVRLVDISDVQAVEPPMGVINMAGFQST